MGKEIERKYRLVKGLEKFLEIGPTRRIEITQGYLSFDPEVRVRLKKEEGKVKATLTIKGKGEKPGQDLKFTTVRVNDPDLVSDLDKYLSLIHI